MASKTVAELCDGDRIWWDPVTPATITCIASEYDHTGRLADIEIGGVVSECLMPLIDSFDMREEE